MALSLPVTRNLSPIFALSLITTLLMAVASLIGIFFQSAIYSTRELLQSFVPNDVVNLFIGLPILLGSMWSARRGKLLGLLFLPGAFCFVLYNYIAYVFATPINTMSLVYIALVMLSAYAMIRTSASIDAKAIQQKLSNAVPEKFGGGVLIGFGILFFFQAIGVLVTALATPILTPKTAVAIADSVITPTWVVSGAMLWRRHPLGYVVGLGLLFQASMLFIALIFFFLLQPLLTNVPFARTDAIVIFAMGLVCFIPFALFARGVASQDTQVGH